VRLAQSLTLLRCGATAPSFVLAGWGFESPPHPTPPRSLTPPASSGAALISAAPTPHGAVREPSARSQARRQQATPTDSAGPSDLEESDSVAEYAAADRARERRVDREQERQEQPGNQHARAAQQATDGTASKSHEPAERGQNEGDDDPAHRSREQAVPRPREQPAAGDVAGDEPPISPAPMWPTIGANVASSPAINITMNP